VSNICVSATVAGFAQRSGPSSTPGHSHEGQRTLCLPLCTTLRWCSCVPPTMVPLCALQHVFLTHCQVMLGQGTMAALTMFLALGASAIHVASACNAQACVSPCDLQSVCQADTFSLAVTMSSYNFSLIAKFEAADSPFHVAFPNPLCLVGPSADSSSSEGVEEEEEGEAGGVWANLRGVITGTPAVTAPSLRAASGCLTSCSSNGFNSNSCAFDGLYMLNDPFSPLVFEFQCDNVMLSCPVTAFVDVKPN
jgi:hypothetical protein